MEITVKLVSQIDSATKPLACDRFDPGGKTLPHCAVTSSERACRSVRAAVLAQ
jgi:hypothetical protein